MGALSWIILGAIAGWVASMLTKHHEGCLANIVIGTVGAMLGGLIFSKIGGHGITGINLVSLIIATAGAVIFIVMLRVVRRYV